MTQLIVERDFETPLSDADLQALAERLLPCVAQYGGNWISSFVSADRHHTVCAFEAPDAESLRMAHRTAEVRLDRLWAADIITPADMEADADAASGDTSARG